MKIRLQTGQPTDEEYLMIGITSSYKDYQLSYFLNKHFSTLFMKQPDIPLYNKKGLIGQFPFYHYYNDDLRMDYYFFSNKSTNAIAIPNYRHFEYLILFKLSLYSIPIQDVLAEIRKIPRVVAALQIPLLTLKNLPEILEDIELHLLEVKSHGQKKKMVQWMW